MKSQSLFTLLYLTTLPYLTSYFPILQITAAKDWILGHPSPQYLTAIIRARTYKKIYKPKKAANIIIIIKSVQSFQFEQNSRERVDLHYGVKESFLSPEQ
jgi:hypothetical protein